MQCFIVKVISLALSVPNGGSPGANAGGGRGRGSSSVHVRVFQLNIAAGPARRPMYFDEMVST